MSEELLAAFRLFYRDRDAAVKEIQRIMAVCKAQTAREAREELIHLAVGVIDATAVSDLEKISASLDLKPKTVVK